MDVSYKDYHLACNIDIDKILFDNYFLRLISGDGIR
jgi:hypothetical protein